MRAVIVFSDPEMLLPLDTFKSILERRLRQLSKKVLIAKENANAKDV